MYNLIIRPLLFCIDPEKVHRMLLSWLKFYRYLFPVRACVRGYSRVSDPFSYGHLQFKNRIGLSAGFDKNAEAFDELADFGFGFLEVGISLKNYLFTMTKNHVLNLIRNENSAISKNYEIAQSAPVYEDNLIENLEKKELMASFYKAVDMLPPQKRSICLMKVKEELTNQEIAERMNLSVNTVKTHYSEALKMLRIHLSKMLIIVTFVTLMTYLSVHYLR